MTSALTPQRPCTNERTGGRCRGTACRSQTPRATVTEKCICSRYGRAEPDSAEGIPPTLPLRGEARHGLSLTATPTTSPRGTRATAAPRPSGNRLMAQRSSASRYPAAPVASARKAGRVRSRACASRGRWAWGPPAPGEAPRAPAVQRHREQPAARHPDGLRECDSRALEELEGGHKDGPLDGPRPEGQAVGLAQDQHEPGLAAPGLGQYGRGPVQPDHPRDANPRPLA